MKGLRQLTILITIILLGSCSNKKENVNGHWHTMTPGIGSFKTLDIGDSITTMDKYQIEVSSNNWLLRKDLKSDESFLPFQFDSWTSNYHLDGDTLKIINHDFSYKYLRSKIEECELADRYSNSAINISLPQSITADSYDDLSYCANVFIGYPMDNDLVKKYPDSVFIQVKDVFIHLSDIPAFISRTKDVFTDDSFKLVLHADKSVGEIFINRVVDIVPLTIPIYMAVDNNGRLGVSKLNAD